MLTGRARFRQSWRGKFILQVEYKDERVYDLNGSGYYDHVTSTHWRDAKFNDVYDIKLNETIVKSILGEVK